MISGPGAKAWAGSAGATHTVPGIEAAAPEPSVATIA
jgi:hypothetical protein